jgi:hypothetical protein
VRTLAVALVALVQVSSAAAGLRANHVYVDPKAELRGQVDAGELRSRIGDAKIYIAVLPASAGDPGAVGRQLVRSVGRPGSYAVVVGQSLRGGPTRSAAGAANAALAAHPHDVQATLESFIGREGGKKGSGSSAAGLAAAALLILVAAGGAALLLYRRAQRSQSM